MPVIQAGMRTTRCAICGTAGMAEELYSENFSIDDLNPAVFSARRLPDRIHFRIVKCARCSLVRSDPMASESLLAELYKHSSFDYSDEVDNLKRTYGFYLRKAMKRAREARALLEIGCGNGFFLEEAKATGFSDVRGVEPSYDAIAQAAPEIRNHIVHSVMRPGLFEAESFDLICLFQVLDHIPDPVGVLKTCYEVLKPGGVILCLNHNVDAVSSRLLRDRSPIIDIEHTYLYSPRTIKEIFIKSGFEVSTVGAVFNTYSMFYLTRLLPAPAELKEKVLNAFLGRWLERIRLTVPLGNLYLIGTKRTA